MSKIKTTKDIIDTRTKQVKRSRSKYVLKIERRRRIATRLGFSDIPFPVLELQDGYHNH